MVALQVQTYVIDATQGGSQCTYPFCMIHHSFDAFVVT